MKRLKLLIVCLLVSYNAFSQKNTADSVVVLTEKMARNVIKDLIRLETCVEIQKEHEKLISIQVQKIETYEKLTCELEEISKTKSKIIENQKKIISKIQKPKLHFYVGIRNDFLQINNTTIFSNLLLCTKKIDFGVHANLMIDTKFTYGITAQYKVF